MDILKQHGLRKTDCRENVLDVFIGQEFALNHSDLERELSSDFDRVTLYRTLNTFLDKGIVHRILDDSGVARFALCPEECEEEEHHHSHIHFKCTSCNNTMCLDHVHIPEFKLPEGYSKSEVDILVQGVCPSCKAA